MIGDLGVLIPILGIIFGTTLVGYIFGKIVGLIKTWINRNNTSIMEEDFDRLAQAFIEYRKDSERRIQNLEAIIVDENNLSPRELSNRAGPKEKAYNVNETIEIEDNEQRKSTNDNSSNLRNMLHKR